MQIVTLHSHVGSDGLLQLQLPDELKNQDVTVIVRAETPEWLSVLQKTAGAIPDLERPPQGQYELRELL
jgi:hypothetical protein